jgi:hypothetical protein
MRVSVLKFLEINERKKAMVARDPEEFDVIYFQEVQNRVAYQMMGLLNHV